MMGKRFGKRRFVVFFASLLVLLSILLAGSGFTKVRGAGFSRSHSRSVEIGRWGSILDAMASEIPQAHREAWREMARHHPEVMMRLAASWR